MPPSPRPVSVYMNMKLLNEGGPVKKDYTEAVPWLESLIFTGADQKPPELHREVGAG